MAISSLHSSSAVSVVTNACAPGYCVIASRSASEISVFRKNGMIDVPRRTANLTACGVRSVRSSRIPGSAPLYFAASAVVPGLPGPRP